ncbi:hypothetical protein FTX61_09815 [Nitriliruptoraceae bacterium ZYF776]|nr:hypothetical protein [Profundirhabdus halotolerans]
MPAPGRGTRPPPLVGRHRHKYGRPRPTSLRGRHPGRSHHAPLDVDLPDHRLAGRATPAPQPPSAARRPAAGVTGAQELRVVVTVDDLAAARHLYHDVLGLPEVPAVSDGHGRVVILEAGRATLELTDEAHAAHIDQLEVGRRTAGHVRLALQVDAVDAGTEALVAAGAQLVAAPRLTPWGSRNARLDDATTGLQLTLFELPEGADETTPG